MSKSEIFHPTISLEKRGKQNQSRGAAFEKLVAARPAQLGLDLMIKRIDRTHRRGVSLPDIELIDFPDFKLDCKFTESEFSVREKRKLVLECHSKYCSENETAIVISGEKKDKSRLVMENVLVCFIDSGLLLLVPLDDWFKHLYTVKLKQLRRET